METLQHTIGLADLLDEIGRDLDGYRAKHPNDYQIKAITLWWELERERLLVRHGDRRVHKMHRWIPRRAATWFLAGWTTFLLAASLLRNY